MSFFYSCYESSDLKDELATLKLCEDGGNGARMAQFVSMAPDSATDTADSARTEVEEAIAAVEEPDSGLASGTQIPDIKGIFPKACLSVLRH